MYCLTVTTTIYLMMIVVERKAVFDKYGEYGLKEGVPTANGSKCLAG